MSDQEDGTDLPTKIHPLQIPVPGPDASRQTPADRQRILANLLPGTRRVLVITQGKQAYKIPSDVDINADEICLASDGSPVVMKGKPGRPSKSTQSPLPPLTNQIAEVSEARDTHFQQSPLLKGLNKNPESEELFNTLMSAIASEADSIEFDRMEAQRHGHETSGLAAKRARVLKSMADLWINRKRITENRMIDLDSPAFKSLFSYTLETFKSAMTTSGCRSELVETVFTNLTKELNDGWKEEAKSRMKGK